MKKVYILLFLSLSFTAKAQFGSQWVFGWHGGIDFIANPPKVFSTQICQDTTTKPNNYINWSSPSSSSVADCEGNLVLYSNDVAIWNKYNKIIPNGYLKNQSGAAIPGGLLLPFPQHDSLYLHLRYQGNTYTNSIIYVDLVDLRLDSGRGGVDTNYYLKKFGNDDGRWGITYVTFDSGFWFFSIGSNNSIKAYKITSLGVDTNPVITKLGFNIEYHFGESISPNNKGDKLILYNHEDYGSFQNFDTLLMLYDFDKKTGKITNPKVLAYYKTLGFSMPTVVRFSPNDSLLYIATSFSPSCLYNEVIQMDLSTKTLTTLVKRSLNAGNRYYVSLAPNNKIYFFTVDTTVLNVIDKPNKRGFACDTQYNAIDIYPARTGFQMPNNFFPIYNVDFSTDINSKNCINDSVHFNNLSDTGFINFTWYFEDGDSAVQTPARNIAGQQTGNDIIAHKYLKEGKYFVRMAGLRNSCGYKVYYEDSIHVYFTSASSISDSFYYGGIYNFNKKKISIAGIYYDTLVNKKGCDSIITLNLKVLPPLHSSFNDSICSGVSYSFFGMNITQSGTYTDTLKNANGCDSVITLNLNVLPPLYSYYSDSICIGVSYHFFGMNITQTGTYSDTLKNIFGCDSVVTLNLTIVIPATNVTNAYMCDNGNYYSWWGKLLNKTGTYIDTFYNNGCIAQFRVLHLLVHPLPAKPTITWNGTFFTSSSGINNQWFRNDTIITGATAQTFTPAKGGDYFVQVSDSNFCVNNSTKYFLWNLSAGDSRLRGADGGIEVYPNPSEGIFTIELNKNFMNEKLNIYNAVGQKIFSSAISNGQLSVDLSSYSKGIYFIRIGNETARIIVNSAND